MSKITVTTIAGQTSGSDANKVKIESGDTLEVVTNATVGGTLGVTGETTLATHLNMGDGDIIKLGDGADLQIKHTGSGSYISDSGTGYLFVQGAAQIRLQNPSGSNYAIFADGGASTLYHNNSAKIATASTGVNVTGGIGLGGTGTANILDDYEEGTFTPNLYHNGSNNSTFSTKTGEYTKIGNTVTCQMRIDHGNSGTAGTFLIIGGLPFAPAQANGTMSIGIWGSNPSSQVGNVMGGSNPTLYKGGSSTTTQMSFFTAMLVYKTS